MHGSITVANLGKSYRVARSDKHAPLWTILRQGWQRRRPEFVWGLRNVSFTVEPGRTVGVVGRNGAGKSSLLRLIGGVGKPDEGSLEVHGRTGAVLEVGAGLTDDMTGRENLMLVGLIAGMTRAEVREREDRIIAFAELEDAIDNPLRTYSTGMKMRLAFSVAIHVDPDILLVDEVLAVGDAAFQRKCLTRIEEIKRSGCTIFFVSHDAAMVRALCDDALYLRAGEVVAFGPAHEVMAMYEAYSREGTTPQGREAGDETLPNGLVLRAGLNRIGSFEAVIRNVRLMTLDGTPASTLLSGAGLVVEFDYDAQEPLGQAIAAVRLQRSDGTILLDVNTDLAGRNVSTDRPGKVRLVIDRLDLEDGEYTLDVGLYAADWSYSYDYHAGVYHLAIIGRGTSNALLDPPIDWQVSDAAAAVDASGTRHVAR